MIKKSKAKFKQEFMNNKLVKQSFPILEHREHEFKLLYSQLGWITNYLKQSTVKENANIKQTN